MKKRYQKPVTEITRYSCQLMSETMSDNLSKQSNGIWDTGAKEREDAEGYINEQEGANSTDGWSQSLW